ncbi:hypothetical protein J2Z65_004168 [Paenibacillus aceris]|uniref:Uncharacterized protein n=1 Tax=Paenibacillus aceris TaxID=869555 RepID=A0ABS4I2A0_9BACL|nr:hypothetical protein [Paenibacillus aceris]
MIKIFKSAEKTGKDLDRILIYHGVVEHNFILNVVGEV